MPITLANIDTDKLYKTTLRALHEYADYKASYSDPNSLGLNRTVQIEQNLVKLHQQEHDADPYDSSASDDLNFPQTLLLHVIVLIELPDAERLSNILRYALLEVENGIFHDEDSETGWTNAEWAEHLEETGREHFAAFLRSALDNVEHLDTQVTLIQTPLSNFSMQASIDSHPRGEIELTPDLLTVTLDTEGSFKRIGRIDLDRARDVMLNTIEAYLNYTNPSTSSQGHQRALQEQAWLQEHPNETEEDCINLFVRIIAMLSDDGGYRLQKQLVQNCLLSFNAVFVSDNGTPLSYEQIKQALKPRTPKSSLWSWKETRLKEGLTSYLRSYFRLEAKYTLHLRESVYHIDVVRANDDLLSELLHPELQYGSIPHPP